MAVAVRDKAPLRLHRIIETPNGNRFRWSADEPSAENIPSNGTFSDTIPGGYEAHSCDLPRKPGVSYQDLERLSTIYVKGAGGEPAWEGRLERTPRQSGTERSISAQGVGWQAHLEDDKTAMEVYVDRDLSHWIPMSRTRRLAILQSATNSQPLEATSTSDTASGLPCLAMEIDGEWAANYEPICEANYDAGPGVTIGSIYVDWQRATSTTSTNWAWRVGVMDDDALTNIAVSADLQNEPNATGTSTHTPATPRRWGYMDFRYNTTGAATTPGLKYTVLWRRVAVWGNHGLTKRGTAPDDGLYASDVIANALSRWAPKLTFSTGANGTLRPSSFIIPQMEFREPTTAAEILKAANRFHIRDWAVWDAKTFYYHDRGDRGRSWRARVAPAQLEETGPQVDRLWNGVIVQYNDVDGTTKTVGPTGSYSDSTSADLTDTDTLNPANQLGIRRWTKIDMGGVSTAAAATEVGRRFLVETKALDSSGKAQLVGYVEDDKGTQRPYWQVRAGDTISFVDAADPSPRRIVRTSKDESSRTCEVDLDAPPEGLDSLLERLGVVLVPLGL